MKNEGTKLYSLVVILNMFHLQFLPTSLFPFALVEAEEIEGAEESITRATFTPHDWKKWVQNPVKLVSLRHSKFYLSRHFPTYATTMSSFSSNYPQSTITGVPLSISKVSADLHPVEVDRFNDPNKVLSIISPTDLIIQQSPFEVIHPQNGMNEQKTTAMALSPIFFHTPTIPLLLDTGQELVNNSNSNFGKPREKARDKVRNNNTAVTYTTQSKSYPTDRVMEKTSGKRRLTRIITWSRLATTPLTQTDLRSINNLTDDGFLQPKDAVMPRNFSPIGTEVQLPKSAKVSRNVPLFFPGVLESKAKSITPRTQGLRKDRLTLDFELAHETQELKTVSIDSRRHKRPRRRRVVNRNYASTAFPNNRMSDQLPNNLIKSYEQPPHPSFDKPSVSSTASTTHAQGASLTSLHYSHYKAKYEPKLNRSDRRYKLESSEIKIEGKSSQDYLNKRIGTSLKIELSGPKTLAYGVSLTPQYTIETTNSSPFTLTIFDEPVKNMSEGSAEVKAFDEEQNTTSLNSRRDLITTQSSKTMELSPNIEQTDATEYYMNGSTISDAKVRDEGNQRNFVDDDIQHEILEEDILKDEDRDQLEQHFRLTHPVKFWEGIGLYNDDYLKMINSHWLKYDVADPMANWLLALLYGILMVVGCSGNFLVILMFFRCRSLRTPPNYLIVNLAVSDFFMMVKMPVFIFNSIYGGPVLGAIGCKVYGFLGGLTGTASIMTLAAIALDRYYVIVYPMNPMKRTTSARAILMLSTVWIYSAFFSSLPLFGVNGYVSEGYLTSCSFDYLSDKLSDRIFVGVFFIAAWFCPLSIIVYSYTRIFLIVRQAERLEFFPSAPNGNGGGGAGALTRESFKYNKHDQKKHTTEVKIALLSSGIILIWLLAWTPYAVVALLGIFGYKHLLTPFVSSIPALFCKTASCIDPFLYAINHPRFQRELKNKFKACYKSNSKKRRTSNEMSYYSNVTFKDNSKDDDIVIQPTNRSTPESFKPSKHQQYSSSPNEGLKSCLDGFKVEINTRLSDVNSIIITDGQGSKRGEIRPIGICKNSMEEYVGVGINPDFAEKTTKDAYFDEITPFKDSPNLGQNLYNNRKSSVTFQFPIIQENMDISNKKNADYPLSTPLSFLSRNQKTKKGMSNTKRISASNSSSIEEDTVIISDDNDQNDEKQDEPVDNEGDDETLGSNRSNVKFLRKEDNSYPILRDKIVFEAVGRSLDGDCTKNYDKCSANKCNTEANDFKHISRIQVGANEDSPINVIRQGTGSLPELNDTGYCNDNFATTITHGAITINDTEVENINIQNAYGNTTNANKCSSINEGMIRDVNEAYGKLEDIDNLKNVPAGEEPGLIEKNRDIIVKKEDTCTNTSRIDIAKMVTTTRDTKSCAVNTVSSLANCGRQGKAISFSGSTNGKSPNAIVSSRIRIETTII